MLGWFCLVFLLVQTLSFNLVAILGGSFFVRFCLSLYLGIRGGRLTARHYVEEDYVCITKDEPLLERARIKWKIEI